MPDVAVEAREALLALAVDIARQLVARLLDGLEEGAEEWVRGLASLETERTAVAAVGVVGVGRQAVLHAPEVRQAMGVVPVGHARVGRPSLEVQRVAALEDHAVDAARAAEHLATSVVDPAAAHERLRLRFVAPVVEPAADGKGERRGHVDEDIPAVVRPAGLQDQHPISGIGAQPVGEGAAC